MQAEASVINIEFHGRDFTDFQLRRLIQATAQSYTEPVTAYLSDVFLASSTAIGVVFGHITKGPYERYSDGSFLQTSVIQAIRKEGRFWVVTTEADRYVIASFNREGRASLRAFNNAKASNHPAP